MDLRDLNVTKDNWQALSPEEKKRELFYRQKHTLDLFLEKGAISKAQYEKSLSDMSLKMGFQMPDNHTNT